jgi:hypothetical protein
LLSEVSIAEDGDRHIDRLQRFEYHLGADPGRIAKRDGQWFHGEIVGERRAASSEREVAARTPLAARRSLIVSVLLP